MSSGSGKLGECRHARRIQRGPVRGRDAVALLPASHGVDRDIQARKLNHSLRSGRLDDLLMGSHTGIMH